MQFEDIYPSHNETGYFSTNEEPSVHLELLKGLKGIKRVGSIASGGEVPIAFLSKGYDVVAIDHAYLALASTYAKIELLKQLGAGKTRDLVLNQPYEDSLKVFKDIAAGAPEKLRPHIEKFSLSNHIDLRRELYFMPFPVLARAAKHLENIVLLHGDLSDLAKRGPFDCLYISNATEHTGRSGRVTLQSVADLVKLDGYVLTTSYYTPALGSGPGNPLKGWEKIKSIKGYRTTWNHTLLKKLPAEASKKEEKKEVSSCQPLQSTATTVSSAVLQGYGLSSTT